MFKAKKIFAIFVSLALFSSVGFSCTGYNALDLIKTDTVSFTNTKGIGPESCYSVVIDFDVPVYGFQTALSIASLNGNRLADGYDFAVRGGQKANSKTLSISLLIDEYVSWTKITVSYLVTARNDIFAGEFLQDAFSQYDCSVTGNQELSFTANVPAIPVNFDYDVKVFVAGIEVKDNEFDFSIKKAAFNARTGVLEIKAITNAVPHVENIYFSYVIYRTGSGSLPFTVSYIPSSFVKTEDYVFHHIASFTKSIPDFLALNFDSERCRCAGKGCADKCSTISKCTSNGGVVNGRDCVICGKSQRWDNGLSKCVPNCRDNEDQDYDNDACKCKPGYTRAYPNDVCKYQCAQNEIWGPAGCGCRDGCGRHDGSCITCPPNSKVVGGQCACDRDYFWNAKKYTCDLLKCLANSTPDRNSDGSWSCKCDKDYYWNNYTASCQYVAPCSKYARVDIDNVNKMWKCVCTDKDYYWNDKRYDCDYLTCPANSVVQYVDNKWACVCARDYLWNDYKKSCDYIACPPRSKPTFYNGVLNCTCDQGYVYNTRKQTCDANIDCGPYANFVMVGDYWDCVCKSDCYGQGKNCKPVPKCPYNSKFNFVTERCDCINAGEFMVDNVCRSCSRNQEYNDRLNKCVCRAGFVYAGSKCVKQCGDYEDYTDDDNCVCKPSCYQGGDKKCSPCQANSRPHSSRTYCVCNDGFVNDKNGACVPYVPVEVKKCPEGMERPTPNSDCVCKAGYIPGAGCCVVTPKCPARSKWIQQKLKCECAVVGEYMIDNQCQPCKANEGWNGKECACTTGYFKIEGVCRTCDANSFYTGKDCACNLGFYGNGREKCNKCHSSCGKCTGPKEDQCTMCSDVSFTLKKNGDCGVCTRNSVCPIGLYNDANECKPCSSYCAECSSESVCKTCIAGFELSEMALQGVSYSYCVEICGDGKRFELDCDDGNKKNGDGCNSDCEVQNGWHCQGGSSIKASTCVNYKPSRSMISLTGTVHLFGKIVQGVRLSYIPPELTANDCMNCHKLLWVRVISSSVVPGVRVNYLPKSQYQFLTEFDFNGLFAIPVFSISIQINPDFASYFTDADMAQLEIKAIDPAVLAKHDNEQTLSADDIDPTKIQVPADSLKDLFPEPKK